MQKIQRPNRIFSKKLMLCIWWDLLEVIYYELLQPNETIPGERYQQQLMQLSRALKVKRPQYAKRHDKIIFQQDNSWPHVAKVVKETGGASIGCSTPPAVFTRPCSFQLPLVPVNNSWFEIAALHFL